MFQVLLNGLIIGGLYALMTIGFNLIYSSVRFHNLTYGVIAVLGGYFTRMFQLQLGLHFIVSLLLSAVVIGFVGVASWQFVFRPMRKKGASDSVMLVGSFGLLLVVQNLISIFFSPNAKSVVISDTVREAYNVLGLRITFNQLIILIVTAVFVVLFELLLTKTKLGMAIRAVGQNRDLASISGVPAERIILYSFFIGTFLSVAGASLSALEIGLRPHLGLLIILKVIISAIIGGIGSIRGALFGGLILGIAENVGIFLLGAKWQDTVAFTLLVIFLLFKPEGLFSYAGSRKI